MSQSQTYRQTDGQTNGRTTYHIITAFRRALSGKNTHHIFKTVGILITCRETISFRYRTVRLRDWFAYNYCMSLSFFLSIAHICHSVCVATVSFGE